MIATGTMPPPAAWLALAAREPRLLQLGVRPGPIHLTPERRAGLKAIQDGVNDGVRYQRDAAGRDVWGVFGRTFGVLTGRLILTGDCDDYAVEKFRRVIAAGWGRAARLVIAYAGEPHMVLAIEAHHRWLVLDNRHPGLWDAAAPRFGGYVWKCRSVPGRLRWERLEGRAATLEDALRRAT